MPIATRVHRYTGICCSKDVVGKTGFPSCVWFPQCEWKPFSGKTGNSKSSLSQFVLIEATGQRSDISRRKLKTWDDVQQTKSTLHLSNKTFKRCNYCDFSFYLIFYVTNLSFIYILKIHNILELNKTSFNTLLTTVNNL